MAERKSTLTDHHYGGHSGVRDDQREAPAVQSDEALRAIKPASHDNIPNTPYVPSGGNEPAGVERYGMYGVAPGSAPPKPATTSDTRPLPGPASLGQYDNTDMDPVAPLSAVQQREVLDEKLAAIVDPGVVRAEFADDTCTLHGTVRDAATREHVAQIASECLPGLKIANRLTVA